jgi:coatomer protein complex subunit gamma
MDGSTEGFEVVHYTPCQVIKCNDTGTTYTLVKLPDDSSAVTGGLTCTMKYTVKDCDPTTGEPDDEEGYADEFTVSIYVIYLDIDLFIVFCSLKMLK